MSAWPVENETSSLNYTTSKLLFIHTYLCPKQDIKELMKTDRPDWQSVMQYVSQIYKYFETWWVWRRSWSLMKGFSVPSCEPYILFWDRPDDATLPLLLLDTGNVTEEFCYLKLPNPQSLLTCSDRDWSHFSEAFSINQAFDPQTHWLCWKTLLKLCSSWQHSLQRLDKWSNYFSSLCTKINASLIFVHFSDAGCLSPLGTRCFLFFSNTGCQETTAQF